MAAVKVDVEEGRGNKDTMQLNSSAVHAFCIGSRSVEHDHHTPHVPSLHSADGGGDTAVRIKLRKAPFLS